MTTPRSNRVLVIPACLLGAAVLGGSQGCEKPLFSPNEARSQYDRFDTMRDQRAAQYVFDEYDRRRPNIRGRLAPRE